MKQRKSLVFDVLFTAACLLLVLFYTANSEAIQHFFTRKLVIPYLQKTNIVLNYPNQQQTFVGWAIYLLLLLMIGFPLLRYVWVHRKRRYPRAIICLSVLFTLFYLLVRYGNSPWMFFPSNHSLKYIDIVGITAILFALWGFRARLRVTPYKKSSNILISLLNNRKITKQIEVIITWKTKILKRINLKTFLKLHFIARKYNKCLSKQIDNFGIDASNGFSFDNPIDKSKSNNFDLLNYNAFTNKVASTIRNTHSTQSAFTIGITGEWGSGKTSFLNLLKYDLQQYKNDKRIIIEFSPWKNHNEKTIITDFFETIASELSKYDYNIESKLQEYAKILVDADVDIVTKYIKTAKSFISKPKSVSEIYEEIDVRIKAIGYQIVIFIDDLDRLYKKEILETLKLIRNSAAFGNMIFIAAYHKDYVESNIAEEIKKHEGYLSKIFQLEFALPYKNDSIYADYFLNLIKYLNIDVEEFQIINSLRDYPGNHSYFSYTSVETKNARYNFFSNKNFESLRDLNQFANQYICSYIF